MCSEKPRGSTEYLVPKPKRRRVTATDENTLLSPQTTPKSGTGVGPENKNDYIELSDKLLNFPKIILLVNLFVVILLLILGIAILSPHVEDPLRTSSPQICKTPGCQWLSTQLRFQLDEKQQPCNNFRAYICPSVTKTISDTSSGDPQKTVHGKLLSSRTQLAKLYRSCVQPQDGGTSVTGELLKRKMVSWGFQSWPLSEKDRQSFNLTNINKILMETEIDVPYKFETLRLWTLGMWDDVVEVKCPASQLRAMKDLEDKDSIFKSLPNIHADGLMGRMKTIAEDIDNLVKGSCASSYLIGDPLVLLNATEYATSHIRYNEEYVAAVLNMLNEKPDLVNYITLRALADVLSKVHPSMLSSATPSELEDAEKTRSLQCLTSLSRIVPSALANEVALNSRSTSQHEVRVLQVVSALLEALSLGSIEGGAVDRKKFREIEYFSHLKLNIRMRFDNVLPVEEFVFHPEDTFAEAFHRIKSRNIRDNLNGHFTSGASVQKYVRCILHLDEDCTLSSMVFTAETNTLQIPSSLVQSVFREDSLAAANFASLATLIAHSLYNEISGPSAEHPLQSIIGSYRAFLLTRSLADGFRGNVVDSFPHINEDQLFFIKAFSPYCDMPELFTRLQSMYVFKDAFSCSPKV